MITKLLAVAVGDDPEHPAVTPEMLVCQGVAALIFLLGVTVLQGLLWLPLQWRDGEMARLVGLLWALPAAVVMTARHASLHLAGDPAISYLRRMRCARLAALLLAVVAFPMVQWRLQGGQPDWMTPTLALPILLSLILLLGASVAADALSTLWFRLPLQAWEGPDRPAVWGAGDGRRIFIDRSRVLGRLWQCWLAGALLMAGALTIHQQAPDEVGVPRIWGMLAFLAYMGLGPLLIGQAARVGRQAQWQLDRIAISGEALKGWGTRGFTLTVIALAGAGLVIVSPIFGKLHVEVIRLLSRLGLPALDGPKHVSVPSAPIAPPSAPPSSGATTWSSQSGPSPAHGGWSFDLPFGIPHLPGLVLALAAAGVLVWSLFWARRYESHGVARWLLLAALADRLASYLRWLLRSMHRGSIGRLWAPNLLSANKKAARAPRRAAAGTIPTAPRQAIFALYLWTLELAARRGYPRRPGQTPSRYADDLRAGLRREQEAATAMADLFMAARFSPRPIDVAEADHMHHLRKAVRRNLRRR